MHLLVDRHYQRNYYKVELTEQIRRSAEDLLEKHKLKAADAIQLASALDVSQRLRLAALTPPVFVRADQDLLTAAAAEDLQTDDPNLHP